MITLDKTRVAPNGKMRRLRKVYYAFYDRDYGPPHPVIRLGGKYLQKFGFNVGDTIEVNLDMGRITISKAADDGADQNKAKA